MATNKFSNHNNTKKSSGQGGPMGGGPAAMMGAGGAKAKDFRGTMKKLIQYLGRYKIALIAVLIFAVLSTVFSILGPKILGQATTIVFEGIMNTITGSGKRDRFFRNWKYRLYAGDFIYHQRGFFLHPGLHHDECFHESYLQPAA